MRRLWGLAMMLLVASCGDSACEGTSCPFSLTEFGLRPDNAQAPPPTEPALTSFASDEGFDVRLTLKGADGNVINSSQMRTKRESGCCGDYWTARI